jgi:hypothetical protein
MRAPSRSSFCVGNSEGFKNCEFTTTWWVDLDAAEVAHPGRFKGQPLVVALLGCIETRADAAGQAGTINAASLTVTLQKK